VQDFHAARFSGRAGCENDISKAFLVDVVLQVGNFFFRNDVPVFIDLAIEPRGA